MALKSRKRKKKAHIVVRVLKSILLGIMILIFAAVGFVFFKVFPDLQSIQQHAYETYQHMSEDDFRLVTDTEIFDKDDKQIGVISSGHRYVYVNTDDISPWIKKAYIAQEDRRFYSHHGWDWMAILRAGVSYVKHRRVTQGGSTITQQVIKNTYLTQERSLKRKITEILLAPQLEKKFGKEKIMEFYCNGNYYAHGCYGVEAASRYYFDKSAKDLEPWEAAVLVGISNRPASYEPINHPKNALRKRNEVLNSLYKQGEITAEELKEYQDKPLEIAPQTVTAASTENYQTSYAIYCTALQLMKNDGFKFKYTFKNKEEYEKYQAEYRELYGDKSEKIRAGGYKIYTTIDSDIQRKLQKRIDDTLDDRSDEKQENGKYALQGAGVIIDNTSNAVVAIVGGRGTDDAYNRGFLARRQPGSTIKPLLDYAPAFETGYFYPSYVIEDREFTGGPKNSGGSYRGSVTLREALNRSLNTVAWQLLQKIDVKTGLAYLGKMEFSSLTWQDSTAAAVSIGGFTYGTRVVDMAKGFSTLANMGVYDDKTCLRSVIYERTEQEVIPITTRQTQVYTEGTAYMITDILKGTMDKSYGTGRGLDIDGQQVAGKTGTANDSKDTWFCGYTRYYTAAVWVGYDTPRAMPGIYGATVSGKIWKNVMTDIHSDLPEKDWVRPDTVELAYFKSSTGERVDYNTGEKDLFNTAIDSSARSAYENAHGTSVADPNANRMVEDDELPSETSSVEESTEAIESLENDETSAHVTAATGVTGVNGGPGVNPREYTREHTRETTTASESSPQETTARRTRAETTVAEPMTTVAAPNANVNGPGGQLHTSAVETKGPGAGLDSPGSDGQVIPRPGVH